MDSKRFYLEQAERTEDHGLKSIYHTLAEEESNHARI
jgi:rubrerythrin